MILFRPTSLPDFGDVCGMVREQARSMEPTKPRMFPEPPLYVHRRNFIHEYAGFRPRVGRSTVEKEVILPPGKALVDSTVFECFVDGGDCNSFHAPIVSNRWSLSTLFESISNKVLDFRTILEHPHVTVPVSEWFGRRLGR